MNPKLAKATVAAVEDLNRARLGERLEPGTFFRIEFHGELALEEPVYGRVIADGSLVFLSGPGAMADALTGELSPEGEYRYWFAGQDRWSELPEPSRELLLSVGVVARREKVVPVVLHVDFARPDGEPQPLRAVNARRIMAAARALLAAVEAGEFEPRPLDSPEGVLVLRIGGEAKRPEWSVEVESPSEELRQAIAALEEEEALDDGALECPPLAGVFGSELAVDQDREWHLTLRLVGPADRRIHFAALVEDGQLMASHILTSLDGNAMRHWMVEAIDTMAGEERVRIPARVRIHRPELFEALEGELQSLGTVVSFEEREPPTVQAALEPALRAFAEISGQ